jgi:hypothetical protein
LTLEMGRQLGELDADVAQCFDEAVTVAPIRGGFVDVDETRVDDELNAVETKGFCPFGDVFEVVEGCFIRDVLCDEDRGAFDGVHDCL